MTSSGNSHSKDIYTQSNTQNNFKVQTITLIAHENECNRLNCIIKNLIVCIMALFILTVGLFILEWIKIY